MNFDTVDFTELDDENNSSLTLNKDHIAPHVPIPGQLGLKRVEYLVIDSSKMELWGRDSLSITPSDFVDDIAYQASEKINLPKIAQERISNLQKYADNIDISKIIKKHYNNLVTLVKSKYRVF